MDPSLIGLSRYLTLTGSYRGNLELLTSLSTFVWDNISWNTTCFSSFLCQLQIVFIYWTLNSFEREIWRLLWPKRCLWKVCLSISLGLYGLTRIDRAASPDPKIPYYLSISTADSQCQLKIILRFRPKNIANAASKYCFFISVERWLALKANKAELRAAKDMTINLIHDNKHKHNNK